MRANFTVYNQWDPKWRNLNMGTSGRTLGQQGCYVTVCAMVLRNFFIKDVTPASLCVQLNQHGGFAPDGQMSWATLEKLYPGVKLYYFKYTKNIQSWHNLAASSLVEIDKAIKDIKQCCAMGQGMGICVDLVPGGSDPDHIVLALETPDDFNKWLVADPDGGRIITFRERYGDVKTAVKGYRGLMGTTANFPDYANQSDKNAGQAVGLCLDDRYNKKDVLDVLMSA